jgi:hypothetical protein
MCIIAVRTKIGWAEALCRGLYVTHCSLRPPATCCTTGAIRNICARLGLIPDGPYSPIT